MLETELKLHVPEPARARVQRAVATARAATTVLQARYVDTPDDRLAAAGLAWRLRREGRRWVQTLKGRGDGLLARPEHEVTVRAPGPDTLPDPALHAGTPVGDLLREVLGDDGLALLECVYRTDIRRVHRLVRHQGAVVEIAFDEGELLAGTKRLAVCELELELRAGPPQALFSLAERWVARHGLWLDVRTKSERGQRLARGTPAPVVRAVDQAALPDEADAAWAAMVQACLMHALPNFSALAAGEGGSDHVHQARVALRRLRTVLRLPPDWHGHPDETARLEAAWREPFARLGAQRDADVLQALIAPPLAAAGLHWQDLANAMGPMPVAASGPGSAEARRPQAVMADPGVTLLVLRTWSLLHPRPPETAPGAAPEATSAPVAAAPDPSRKRSKPGRLLKPLAQRWLRGRWRTLRKEAEGFDAAPLDAQHRLRKRLKRLRYALELLEPTVGRTPEASRVLRRLLEALGVWNDRAVAVEALAGIASQAGSEVGGHGAPAAAWWARGWLQGRESAVLQAVRAELAAFRALRKPFGARAAAPMRDRVKKKPAKKPA